MKTVVILLCTYQGERFLQEQIESFITQTHSHWKIMASDDGSTDNTLNILKDYQQLLGEDRLEIYDGPKTGFANNFLSLVARAKIQPDYYYAYSDQDDIWKPDKLERAVQWIDSIPSSTPALYCSRCQLIDAKKNILGYTPLFTKKATFKHALIQSISGGNTMIFNSAANMLIKDSCKYIINPPSHDRWTYLLISGCGGIVYYDAYQSISYRQHDSNVIGSNNKPSTSKILISILILIIAKLFNKKLKIVNTRHSRHIANLYKIYALLTPENQQILDTFSSVRHSSIFSRLLYIKRSGFYYATFRQNISFIKKILFDQI